MTPIVPERKVVRRWLSRLGSDTLENLLQLQEADMGSKGTGMPSAANQFTQIRALAAEIQVANACLSIKDLAVNGRDLMALGFAPGKKLGNCLQNLFERVLDERLPNERAALLACAEAYLSQEVKP